MQICQKTGRSKILLVPSASLQTRDCYCFHWENKMHYLVLPMQSCISFLWGQKLTTKQRLKNLKLFLCCSSTPPQHHGAPCSACAVTPDRPRTPLCDLAQGEGARVLHQAVEINPCFLTLLMHGRALESICSSPAGSRNMFPVPLRCVPLCAETGVCHPPVMLRE